MWNKYKKRIAKLEEENHWLNKNYSDAKRDLEKRKEEPSSSVTVYLKNKSVIKFKDADGYWIYNENLEISKGETEIGTVKIEEVIAISLNNLVVYDTEMKLWTTF